MAKIHVLDSETIDKIAAGEVVERPSSVVKELVENAIDAGATAITVEAKEGGIEFLRIADNGSGMEPSQVRTAFLRHATSKISSADDLTRVSSLGFRGEALSSIAAVSKVEVITKTKDALTGVRYMMEGAVEKSYEEVGAPQGTTFIMRNLFYNTPVRRKFLKQPATEGGYIADLMEHMALSRPDVSFKFMLNNQLRFHTSGNGDLKEVIYRIYGRDVAAQLVPIQVNKDGIRVEGYLGKPVLIRSNRNFEIYYINRRFIKSQLVAKAIEEGYKEYLMQHKFPFCVLHIAMDQENVDVNVHPTKMDVRFCDAPAFCNLLVSAVRETLRKREMIPEATLSEKQTPQAAAVKNPVREKTPEPFEYNRTGHYRVMEETRYDADKSRMKEMLNNPVWSRVFQDRRAKEDSEKLLQPGKGDIGNKDDIESDGKSIVKEDSFFVEAKPLPQQESILEVLQSEAVSETEIRKASDGTLSSDKNTIPEETKPEQLNLFEEKLLSVENRAKYQIIGQIFNTYWLVQFEDKLFIIDQHAAHEKVKYERLMKQYKEKQILSQGLMPPVIVSLTGQEEAVLNQYLNTFAALGFEIEGFGGSEYAIRSVPVDLYGCGEKEMFLEVLDDLSEGTSRGSLKAVEEKIASMSCKAAVKGNNRLSQAEAESLIDELLTLENPYNCPHGRPTIISMTREELEKKFKRIV